MESGHIQRVLTLTDPQVFNKPITVASRYDTRADAELLDFACADHCLIASI